MDKHKTMALLEPLFKYIETIDSFLKDKISKELFQFVFEEQHKHAKESIKDITEYLDSID